MSTPRTLLNVPPKASRGQIVTVRAMAQHAMENGFRHDEQGRRIARDMIGLFRAEFGGVEVFRADLVGGIAANPLMQFTLRVMHSGRLEVVWEGDHGYRAVASALVEVS